MSRLEPPRTVYAERIYPVPVKPAGAINSWRDWPDDVRSLLITWNSGRGSRGRSKVNRAHRLSFQRSSTGSIFEAHVSVFKCVDCEAYCKLHVHGAAVLDGDWLCDECLIERARVDLSQAPGVR